MTTPWEDTALAQTLTGVLIWWSTGPKPSPCGITGINTLDWRESHLIGENHTWWLDMPCSKSKWQLCSLQIDQLVPYELTCIWIKPKEPSWQLDDWPTSFSPFNPTLLISQCPKSQAALVTDQHCSVFLNKRATISTGTRRGTTASTYHKHNSWLRANYEKPVGYGQKVTSM